MVFIDTGFFVALKNNRDRYHKHAQHLAAQIFSGKIIKPNTCDFVFDEAVNVPRKRISDKALGFKISCDIGKAMLNGKYWNMKIVQMDNVKDCFDDYSKHSKINMSFTDWMVGYMAKKNGDMMVITSDSKDFKKVIKIYGLDKPIYLMKNEDFEKLKEDVQRNKAKPEELIFGKASK